MMWRWWCGALTSAQGCEEAAALIQRRLDRAKDGAKPERARHAAAA
jgi:hypothetical protein